MICQPLRLLFDGLNKGQSNHPLVDVIAVHGLNPRGKSTHAWDTWRKPSGPGGNLWLRDQLPDELPQARIFLYEYDSSPAFGSGKDRFLFQANDFLERIKIERDEVEDRPLLFIGHSLGGILIKQALVNAHNNPEYTPIKSATFGLIFFGTPHSGGTDGLVKMGHIASRIVTSLSSNPSNDLMEAVKHGSLYSDILQEGFRQQLLNYQIVSFYEGIGDIVSRESAVIGLPGNVEAQLQLKASHSEMCRFDPSSQQDLDNYKIVNSRLKGLYKEVVLIQSKLAELPQQLDLEQRLAALSKANATLN